MKKIKGNRLRKGGKIERVGYMTTIKTQWKDEKTWFQR